MGNMRGKHHQTHVYSLRARRLLRASLRYEHGCPISVTLLWHIDMGGYAGKASCTRNSTRYVGADFCVRIRGTNAGANSPSLRYYTRAH